MLNIKRYVNYSIKKLVIFQLFTILDTISVINFKPSDNFFFSRQPKYTVLAETSGFARVFQEVLIFDFFFQFDCGFYLCAATFGARFSGASMYGFFYFAPQADVNNAYSLRIAKRILRSIELSNSTHFGYPRPGCLFRKL